MRISNRAQISLQYMWPGHTILRDLQLLEGTENIQGCQLMFFSRLHTVLEVHAMLNQSFLIRKISLILKEFVTSDIDFPYCSRILAIVEGILFS